MAVLAALLPLAEQQFVDTNGVPLAGGAVYFYVPGTTTAKTTWRDSGQATANPQPVILDAAGRALIYGEGQYRQVVYDASGNLIWDQVTTAPITSDQISQSSSSPLSIIIGTSGGAALVQGGFDTTNSAGQAVVVFQNAFPNSCVSFVASVVGSNSAPNRYILEIGAPLTPSSVAVVSTDIIENSFVGDIGFSWLAIGF